MQDLIDKLNAVARPRMVAKWQYSKKRDRLTARVNHARRGRLVIYPVMLRETPEDCIGWVSRAELAPSEMREVADYLDACCAIVRAHVCPTEPPPWADWKVGDWFAREPDTERALLIRNEPDLRFRDDNLRSRISIYSTPGEAYAKGWRKIEVPVYGLWRAGDVLERGAERAVLRSASNGWVGLSRRDGDPADVPIRLNASRMYECGWRRVKGTNG